MLSKTERAGIVLTNALIFFVTMNRPFSFCLFPECHFLIKSATVLWCSLHPARFHPLGFLADMVPRGCLYFQQAHTVLYSSQAAGEGNKDEWDDWRSTYSSNSLTVFLVTSLKKHKQVQLGKSLDILCDGSTNPCSLFCVIAFLSYYRGESRVFKKIKSCFTDLGLFNLFRHLPVFLIYIFLYIF